MAQQAPGPAASPTASPLPFCLNVASAEAAGTVPLVAPSTPSAATATAPPSATIDKYHSLFAEFVPRCALEWHAVKASGDSAATHARTPHVWRERAVVAFLDVSGFTPMTEKLGERGAQGAELVCSILSDYFSELLRVVCVRWGGDVVKFAGDALLVIFRVAGPAGDGAKEDDAMLQAALRAIQSALEAARIRFERHGVPLALKVRSDRYWRTLVHTQVTLLRSR